MRKAKKHRLLKWIGGVIGAVVLIVAAAAIYLSAKWKPLATEKIKAGVYKGSDRLYNINFKDIHLNLFSGNVTLDSITLLPDTAVFDSLKRIRKAPVHLFELKLAKLQFSRISLLTAYFKKRIEMNEIVLVQPSINMIYHKVPKRTDTVKDERTLYQQLSGALKSIHIKAIRVKDADFDYYNRSNTNRPANAIRHLDIGIKDLLIDSVTQFDTTRLFYAKDIGFELVGYRSVTKDKMYDLQADTLTGSATSGYVKLRGLKLIPRYPDLAFSRKYSTQKDRYDLSFSEVDMTGVNFREFNNNGKLKMRKLSVGAAKVNVFMNRELPPPNFDKVRNFPHLALRRLPVESVIDTIQLQNIDVAYTEFSEQTKKRGTIRLENLRGTIKNVTNDSLRLTKNNFAVADLKTVVMGTGKLAIRINFNLTAANGAFDYAGQFGRMDLKTLNPLATNLGLVAIESGVVQKMDFKILANAAGATGIVNMYYNDLKVNLLKEKDGKIKEKGLLSLLANSLVVIDNNPKKGKPFRQGKAAFSRTMTSSFFNLLWKGVFTGIRETVGIGGIPMKTPPQPKLLRPARSLRTQ